MRTITALQPSGEIHLGNYFSAIQAMLERQKNMKENDQLLLFIADYHALTSSNNAKTLSQNITNLAKELISCGINPEKITFFKQSDIPEVCELTWFLSNVCPVGLLERSHSYKDKIAKGHSPSMGLFAYPVLMSADILLYDVDEVPVGKDQKQHLEITRDIANKFNEFYKKNVFKLPQPKILENTAVVPGIDGEKMSKSYGNTIPIFANKNAIKKKIMSIKTDSTPVDEPKNHQNSVIYKLYSLIASKNKTEQMKNDFQKGGIGYGEFKKQLLNEFLSYFKKMHEKMQKLEHADKEIQEILANGAEKARPIAQKMIAKIRKANGISF